VGGRSSGLFNQFLQRFQVPARPLQDLANTFRFAVAGGAHARFRHRTKHREDRKCLRTEVLSPIFALFRALPNAANGLRIAPAPRGPRP
jgi:hypothetical protein